MVPMQPERRSLSTCLAQILSASAVFGHEDLDNLTNCSMVLRNKWLKMWSSVLKFCTASKYSVCQKLACFLQALDVGWLIWLKLLDIFCCLKLRWRTPYCLFRSFGAKLRLTDWPLQLKVLTSNHPTCRCPCITPLPKRWRRPCDLGYKGCRSLRGKAFKRPLDVRAICHKILYFNI